MFKMITLFKRISLNKHLMRREEVSCANLIYVCNGHSVAKLHFEFAAEDPRFSTSNLT